MKKLVSIISVSVFMIFAANSLAAQDCGTGEKHAQAKILAVKFHADYCGACKALNEPLEQLEAKLDGESVNFTRFDFTSASSKKMSAKKAEELGIKDIYKSRKGTGFVLLIDSETKETLATLTRKQSVDEMYDVVKKHL